VLYKAAAKTKAENLAEPRDAETPMDPEPVLRTDTSEQVEGPSTETRRVVAKTELPGAATGDAAKETETRNDEKASAG
jgi:hypothetical protein